MKQNKVRHTSVDEYIKTAPKKIQSRLRALRKIIQSVAPDAVEGIGYNIPSYKLNGILIYFAVFEEHIGLYPYTPEMKLTKAELLRYRSGKGTLKFVHDIPLPLAFIAKIVTRRAKEQCKKMQRNKPYFVYILKCADGTFYTGIARDVLRREDEHNGDRTGGAKYTRARRPVKVVYTEAFPSRSAALRREYEIKKLSREKKRALIDRATPH